MRDLVGLSCERCKNKNYTATKNKKLTPDKFDEILPGLSLSYLV